MTREQYVRPPLVARETPNPAFARWRYRLVAGVLALAALILFTWLFLTFSGVTNGEDPGLGGLSRPPAAP